jgi:hypothetical protein
MHARWSISLVTALWYYRHETLAACDSAADYSSDSDSSRLFVSRTALPSSARRSISDLGTDITRLTSLRNRSNDALCPPASFSSSGIYQLIGCVSNVASGEEGLIHLFFPADTKSESRMMDFPRNVGVFNKSYNVECQKSVLKVVDFLFVLAASASPNDSHEQPVDITCATRRIPSSRRSWAPKINAAPPL